MKESGTRRDFILVFLAAMLAHSPVPDLFTHLLFAVALFFFTAIGYVIIRKIGRVSSSGGVYILLFSLTHFVVWSCFKFIQKFNYPEL